MRQGYEIAKLVKELKSDSDIRFTRAMFVANAFAFTQQLDPTMGAMDYFDTTVKDFRSLLRAVNETTPVDTDKAIELYRNMLLIRYQLLNGVGDPDLMRCIMCCETTKDYQTLKENAISVAMGTNADVIALITEANNILNSQV